ncbi:MAG: DNA methyltransferase [Hyphomonadaceae bacterium]|nr:DNA methyltransferase [Hyphomonadaceae bacterium]
MTPPLAYNRDYALNAICPYFTMFPLEYPTRILSKHRRDDPVVVDPFCGRGTTIYAARKSGLRSYGFDVSSIAIAIAKAKLASASVDQVIALAEHLLSFQPRDVPDTEFFERAYAPSTLKDICRIREGLLRIRRETDASVLLRAAMLGCLHGPMAKHTPSSGYFSNQMPRTFSSKPDYSVRFWDDRELKAPRVSVLKVLRRKLERIPDLDGPTIGTFDRVRRADARLATPYRNLAGDLVVVTSPPYYGMRTYVQDQWLRNWFLGGPEEVDYEADTQVSHAAHDDFVRDLARVWTHLKNRGDTVHLYVRLGTIPSVTSDAKALFCASLEESGDWRLAYTQRAKTASEGKRQADQMRGGSAAEDEYDFHAVAA